MNGASLVTVFSVVRRYHRALCSSSTHLLLQAMEDIFISCLGLAVGLGVWHGSEARLAAQVTEVVHEFTSVELSTVIKNYGTRDAEAGDDVPPNELSYFGGGDGGVGFGLYQLGEVVYRYKEILSLPRSLGKRAENIHSPCGEWQEADNRRHGGGANSLDGGKFLKFLKSPH